MLGKQIHLYIAAFLIVGFFFLALPKDGLAVNCCQLKGSCTDSNDVEGPFACLAEDFVENAFCNESTNLCQEVPISRDIPTLSEWGLITMAGILAIAGYIGISRRKVKA